MTLGLLLTALGLGLRHGVDWDHIAAIADLSSAAEDRRRGFVLSMLYAVGHGVVVFGLGVIAIIASASIPESVDAWTPRVVGVTLIALGLWILIELVRKGRDFRLQSRWMLIINGTFAGLRRVKNRLGYRSIEVEHEHEHEHVDDEHGSVAAHDHSHTEVGASVETLEPVPAGRSWLPSMARGHKHSHGHQHRLDLPTTADAGYGNGTAAGIGMLHGIGIESPTQIAIFVASTAAVGTSFGLMLLGAWVAGLIVANAVIALMAGAGLLQAERSFAIYATLAVVISVGSIAMGLLYLGGFEILPELS